MKFISPVLKRAFKILPAKFYFPILGGVMRGINWVPKSANPGQVLGRYEPVQERALRTLLRESSVFWDVGAHVGWYSLLASKVMPDHSKIVCFEPNPANIKYIERHIEINRITNITLQKVALSSKEGECFFSGDHQQGQLSDTGDYKVTTTTVSKLIQDGTPIPDLLKVDIEGAEIEFLNGAAELLESHKPTFVMSAHGYKKRDECVDIFNKNDYSLEHLVVNEEEGDYVFIARCKK